LRCAIIRGFSSRDWYVVFRVLLHPVEDLLFTIWVEGDMLSSLCGLVQPARKNRLDTSSRAIECSRHCIDRDWNIVTRFCNILHEWNLLASKFKSSKIRVPLYEFADLIRKAEQFEVWQEDIEVDGWRRGRVSRHFAGFNATLILQANDIWFCVVCACSLVIFRVSSGSPSHVKSFDS
jgi:hypothetical protein